MSMRPDDKSNMIALGCLSPKGLYETLERNKNINTVSLLLDNDEPGEAAYKMISEELTAKGYKVVENEIFLSLRESGLKDINEYLLNIHNPIIEITKTI